MNSVTVLVTAFIYAMHVLCAVLKFVFDSGFFLHRLDNALT